MLRIRSSSSTCLRSFTTAAVALAQGASAIYPVEGVAAAIALAGRIQHPVSVGAVVGGDPAPGFDFGNSPSQLMHANLAGKDCGDEHGGWCARPAALSLAGAAGTFWLTCRDLVPHVVLADRLLHRQALHFLQRFVTAS
jgi:hypothetical protein